VHEEVEADEKVVVGQPVVKVEEPSVQAILHQGPQEGSCAKEDCCLVQGKVLQRNSVYHSMASSCYLAGVGHKQAHDRDPPQHRKPLILRKVLEDVVLKEAGDTPSL